MKDYVMVSPDQRSHGNCKKFTVTLFSSCLTGIFFMGAASACVTSGAGLLRYIAKNDHYKSLVSPLGVKIGSLGALMIFPIFLFFSYCAEKFCIRRDKIFQGALLNVASLLALILPGLSLATAILDPQKGMIEKTVLSYLTSFSLFFLLGSIGTIIFCVASGSAKKKDSAHSALFQQDQQSWGTRSQTSNENENEKHQGDNFSEQADSELTGISFA